MMVQASISIRLRQAILANDISLVERILNASPQLLHNPDFRDKSNTSLHLAAQAGYTELAELLISLGHDQTLEVTDYIYSNAGNNQGVSTNTDGHCPLHIAAIYHHVDMIELLCTQFPRTVNRVDKDGRTPLLLASGSSTTNPRTITAGGRKLTPQSTEDVRSIETLLKHGAHVRTQDHKGNTCLHQACAWGNLKAVRVLVQAGADPLCANYAGWKPDAYSLTVQADVYFRNLVAEFEKRKAAEAARRNTERKGNGGGRVRLVHDEDEYEDDESDDNTGDDSSRSRAGSGRSNTAGAVSSGEGLGINVGTRTESWNKLVTK